MAGLAALHTSLNHRPPANRHFFRGELEEFYNKLRSDVKFPCMILEGSEIDYEGQSYNLTKIRHCAFMIVDSIPQLRDYEEIQERMSRCERIGEQVMGRIIKEAGDPKSGSPFARLLISEMSAEYWHNEPQKYVAFRMRFTVKGKVQLCGEGIWSDEVTPDPPTPPTPPDPPTPPEPELTGVLLTEVGSALATERHEVLGIENDSSRERLLKTEE